LAILTQITAICGEKNIFEKIVIFSPKNESFANRKPRSTIIFGDFCRKIGVCLEGQFYDQFSPKKQHYVRAKIALFRLFFGGTVSKITILSPVLKQTRSWDWQSPTKASSFE
jgi:hypothetical protein